ncbi:MAG TPA: M6 family metalloprotease domain-containing protein [Thermoplasmata archaeon]|nr:M6 family metalloprotease domain-containing protein [Thermoplasmata archaeon]
MRGLGLLLAIVLAAAAIAAGVPLPRTEVWEVLPGSAPQFTPPNPAAGGWPPYVQRSGAIPPATPAQTTGVARVLILLIRFTDIAQDSAHDGPYFDGRMNGAAGSVRSYYREVSRGALTVNATVVSTWFPSAHPMSYYGADSPTGIDDANGPIYRLVVEAVRLADPTVDFAQFDTNSDGVVDHLMVVHAGAGEESDPTNKDLIWSHRWAVLDADPATPGYQSLTVDGVQVYGYTMESEDFVIGTAAHEFGHDLGLPDLYDTDGSSHGAGVWDVMSEGSWNGAPAGSSPAHFSAWSLIQLGWATLTDVTTSLVTTPIEAVETSGKVLRLGVPGKPQEYFLVENRQPTGFDAGLPGSGLLIWHVDDAQPNNDQDAHRKVDLLEADESISGDRPTQSSDPWRDSPSGWGPDSIPDSRTYDGTATGWRVRDVSASTATMTATVARDVTKDLAVSAIRLPFTEAVGTLVRSEVDVRNDGAQAADVSLSLEVYRDTLEPGNRLTASTFTQAGLAAQTTATFRLNFTPTSTGRYLVHARLQGADDEIPSNDERVAHVLVNAFRFHDAADSGLANWTTNGGPDDLHRWRIVNDSEADGAAHSRPRAWRFGYVATLLPSLFPPRWHTLTSTAIDVVPGPTYLIFYHRYDLTGRAVEVLPIGSNNTDEAYVEVSTGGGPWVTMARYTGRDLAWRGVSFDLTANIMGATTLQIRFNASSDVIGKSGGWWIDDVMVASLPLGRAAILFGPSGVVEGTAGGKVRFDAKLANVGEYETDFRLDGLLPAGWNAALEGGSGGLLRGRVVRLAPDNDAALRIALTVASSARSGDTYPVTINTTAVEDPTAGATVTVSVRVTGLSIEWIAAAVLIVAAVLLLIVALVVRRRRRPLP